ncbi:TonB-dependent siderophore receptor [Altererythrobacter confluentis]|uniref:TonB-dependent siderophore receptor n=1 Tax=Allopontixanthobacter confluentis TaxID=1849021 RepID=A0A6L7GF54_9SPHN|nr:TonB-dependent siderophore receptor [Allopontixanthobacter confluentis]MXP13281.1 TonB-dependent siderophore receptor [Allopontixanthobacter confluentis]
MYFTKFRTALLASAILAVPAAPAFAAAEAEPERDYLPSEIVVTGLADGYSANDGSTATKTPTPLIDVPQSVSVITDDQLQDQAIRQLGDALRYIPGISLETGEGHRDEVFIRGQESSADFYLDGLRDDAQYYRSLYNVERIEVLKGANALIFGRGGGGGVVNRVSKTASLTDQFAEFEGSVDNFGAFALTTDLNQPLSGTVGARLNATYEEFANARDFYEGRFIGISPTITAELGADTRITTSYSYDDDARVTDRGVPALGGLPLSGYDKTFFGDANFNYATSEAHIGRARIDHRFSAGLTANASVQYANYDKAYANVLPRSTNGTTVDLTGYRDVTARENLIGQANLVWETGTGSVDHTIMIGLEAGWQDTQNSRQNVLFDTGFGLASAATVPLARQIFVPPVSLTDPARIRDSQLETLSLYAQDQIKIGDHLELVGGVRWDRFDLDTVELLSGVAGSRVDEMVSPRFGMVVKPNDTLSIYASYTTSFLPQSGDQFLALTPDTQAFEPEKFTNYEVGAKWLLKPDLFLTAAAFRLDRSNSRAPDPANTGLSILTGASRTQGAEFSLVGKITSNWEGSLSYTYMDGELRTTTDAGAAGTRLQQLPRHQISAWNRFQITDRFAIGAGAIYQDDQFASYSGDVVLPSYWRFDAAAFYEVADNATIQLNIQNLFDENYYASAHGDNNIQPGAPLTARLGLRLTL